MAIRFPKPSPLGWCPAQRIRILMIAGGNHTIIHAVMAVSRKLETDEGLASPYGRGALKGRRERYLPSQSFRDSSPRVGAKGETDCHASVSTGSQ